MTGRRLIYMDHAATTPTHPDVVAAMLPYFTERFGNPSSLYVISNETRAALAAARGQVAGALGTRPDEIFFTSGGTEADNWALKGVAMANRKRGRHIITSEIEHHAILHTAEVLDRQGFDVTYLPVDPEGLVDPGDLEDAITDETVLVSVMTANNEIGTIQPVAELGAIARDHGAYFHTDAVQAVGHIPLDVDAMNIDLLSLSAHKFYGPRGAGALYIRNGTCIESIIQGGAQERGMRAGTENTPGIVGLGAAISRVTADISGHTATLSVMRDRLVKGLLETIPQSRLNGHPTMRLCNNANFSFANIDGEALLLLASEEGVCASTGSACSAGSDEPSHVLNAIGLPPSLCRGSLRLTLGELTTDEDIAAVTGMLPGMVERLRAVSPFR
jgi:cysteine desulfurase